MKKIRPFWLRISIILSSLLVVSVNGNNLTGQCQASITPLADYSVHKDRGGLNAMCKAAEDMRYSIVKEKFPYSFYAEQAKLWYDTGRINSNSVLKESLYYVRDVLWLASFFLFLGIGIPAVASMFWFLWQQCYEDDQDDEIKNATYQEQVFAWVLGVGLLLCCICMIVFVSLLLVGNSLLSNGTKESTDAAVAAIPQAMRLRNETIDSINYTLLTKLISSVNSLNSFESAQLSENCSNTSVALVFDKMDIIFDAGEKLYDLLSPVWEEKWWTEGSGSLSIPSALSQIQASLDMLIHACANGKMHSDSLCGQVRGILLPDEISGDELSKDVLGRMKESTTDSMLIVEESRHAFEKYRNSTMASLKVQIAQIYANFEEELIDEATQELDNILLPLRRLHFGLPQSQIQVEDFASDKQVNGWVTMTNSRTLLFAIIVLLLIPCICYAMARGSYNIYYIYLCGNDSLFVRRAHQAGMMLKKLAYCFYVVCFAASLGMTAFMAAAGALGGACGDSRNFTEILTFVIDNNNTWGEGERFPLAKMVLGNPDYMLLYQNVLSGCSHGNNIYTVLDLEQNNFSINNYHPVAKTLNNFTSKMSKVPIKPHQLLDNDLHNRLVLLNNAILEIGNMVAKWRNYIDSFNQQLVNLDEALTNSSNFNDSNSDDLMQNTLVHLSMVLSNIQIMINQLDDIDVKLNFISEQNITALLIQLQTRSFENDLLGCYHEAIDNITDKIANKLREFEKMAPSQAQCNITTCQDIAKLYYQFSAGICKDVLDGLDLSWASFACIFVISVAIIVLSLILASRFVDYELTRAVKFSLWDSCLRQMLGSFWLLLLVAIDIWVIIDIRNDKEFPASFCEGRGSSCCASCVWGFGILFVLLILMIGLSSRVYQCLLVYRINVFDQVKVRKYFHIRKKSIQFYTQLFIFLFQDIPFSIISGTYLTSVMRPMVSIQLCFMVCAIDILVYIVYIVRERKNVNSYLTWSREKLKNYRPCLSKQRTAGRSQYSPRYQHDISDDEDDPNHRYLDISHSPNHGITDEFVYEGYPDRESPANHAVLVEPRPQYVSSEEGEGQQVIGAEDYELEETESEISDSDTDQSESASNIGRLDESNPNSEAVRLRQEAAQLHATVTYGVEVATPLVTTGNLYRSDISNLDNSYMFSSMGSFEPSSSQYESSDYRDDDESDHEGKWHQYGQFYTVDV